MKINKLFLAAAAFAVATTTAIAGDGTWVLDGSSNWSATTSWNGGIVADGSGATANFTNDITTNRTVTLDTAKTIGNIVFSDAGTGTPGSWLISGANTLTLAGGTPTITVNAPSATISSAFNFTAGLNKEGNGTLALTLSSQANNNFGTTNINAGTLKLDLSSHAQSQYSLGTISTGPAGTLELYSTTNSIDTSGYMASTTFNGSGTITKTGSGYVDIGWQPGVSIKNFAGQINIQSGGLATNGSDWGTTGAGVGQMSVNVSSGAYFDLRNNGVVIDKLTGGGTIGTSYVNAQTLTVGNNQGSSTFSGVIQNGITAFSGYQAGGTIALTKNGTGTLTLTGANTYTGATTVNGGTLRAGSSTAFSSGSAVTLANTAGVTLDINGQSVSIGSLAGGGSTGGVVTLGGGTLTAGGNNTSTSFAGSMTGAGTFVKAGSGTLTLDYSTNDVSKLSDTASLTLKGGTLNLKGGTHVETVGSVAITGMVNITRDVGGGTSLLALGNFTNSGVLNVGTTGLATTTVSNNGSGYLTNVLFGGTQFAMNDGAGNIVAATGVTYTDVNRLGGVVNDSPGAIVRIIDGGSSGSVTLGAATTNIGTLFHTATAATTVDLSTNTLNLAANGVILTRDTSTLTISNGSITAGSGVATTLNVRAGTNAITIGSNITDNGAAVGLNTTGNVVLNGVNKSYTGDTTIGSGTLQVAGAITLGSTGTYAGNIANAGTLQYSSSSNQTLSGVISGVGALVKDTGNVVLTLGGASSNTYTGATTINSTGQSGGILAAKTGGAIAIVGDINLDNAGFSNLRFGSSNQLGGNGVLTFVGTAGNHGRFMLEGTNQSIAGVVNNGTASGVVQNSENGFGGSTGAATAGTLTLTGAGTYSFGGYMRNGAAGSSLALVKNGSGTQIFIGNQITYNGGTTINSGKLLFNSTSALAGGTMTVNNLGTLGGSGTVSITGGGLVTVNSGATLQGGAGATGETLTIANGVSLASGSIIQLALGGAGAHSTLARTGGTWTFDGTQKFTFLDLGATTGTYSNLITGLAADPGTEAGWTITNAGWVGTFSYNSGNISLVLTAVPEPSTYGLIGAGVLAVAAGVRRRRRHAGKVAA